jgi:hypothetical protein
MSEPRNKRRKLSTVLSILVQKLEGKNRFGDLGETDTKILKWMLKIWLQDGSGQGLVAGSFEHGSVLISHLLTAWSTVRNIVTQVQNCLLVPSVLYYSHHNDGVTLRLCTEVTNGPIFHSVGDIWT